MSIILLKCNTYLESMLASSNRNTRQFKSEYISEPSLCRTSSSNNARKRTSFFFAADADHTGLGTLHMYLGNWFRVQSTVSPRKHGTHLWSKH